MDSYNVNRKVVTFGDFTNNIESEKEELKKVKRSTDPNSDEHQQHIGNGRYKFNKVTRKMDDLSPAEVQDKLDAIDELEETNESVGKLRAFETSGRFSPDILILKINELVEVVNNLEKKVEELENK
jgi:hypothetical protein